MADTRMSDPPSTFVAHWAASLATSLPSPRRALDVAMGRGRHATLLARLGYRVFGVDNDLRALITAMHAARGEGQHIRGWCADLMEYSLPHECFELVVVARYLQRSLFSALRELPIAGGVVLYETFSEAQLACGSGPKSPDHLLKPGELLTAFRGFDILFHGEISTPYGLERIVARRPVDQPAIAGRVVR